MEFKKEINEMQRKLSVVNMDFLEFVEKNPGCLELSNFKPLELNNKLFTLQPWPTFISAETRENFRDAGEKLFELIKTIPKRIFNNDPQKISKYFGLPPSIVKIQLDGVTQDHINQFVSRGDFIISNSGMKCIEYNVTPALGGIVMPIWELMYYDTPIIAKFLNEYDVKPKNENLLSLLFKHTVDSTLKKFSGDMEEINTALVIKKISSGIDINVGKIPPEVLYYRQLYKQVLQDRDKPLKGELVFCDFSAMKLVNNKLFYNNKRIHSVIETFFGLISLDVLIAFKAGNIALFNGPISDLLSNKLTLAALSDHESFDVFTAEEKRIIDTYIPWTRKTVAGSTNYGGEKIDDLEYFVRSNREKLVLKPSKGYGGTGISVGKKTSPEKWEEAVKKAFKEKNWLAQEMVEVSSGVYQTGEIGYDLHDMVWGFFIFGSKYCGAWVRVMPQGKNKGVINCHQGATVSIIFDVDK